MRDDFETRWRELGEFIREQRRVGHLSLRKLSEMAGISNPYLSQIERGLRHPSAEILQQIARALRISAETLYVRAGILDESDEIDVVERDPPRSAAQRGAEADPGQDLRVVPERERRRAGQDPSGICRLPGALNPLVRRLAVLSLHTSPLVQPGVGDSGGMNVYVRELVSALAQAGVDCTVYVRRGATTCPRGRRRAGVPGRHVDAGPPDLPKEALPETVDEFADAVRDDLERGDGADVIHANYWLSGVAGHRLKHELDLPLVSTFHTLARVKAETGDAEPERRERAETEVIGCSDAILACCTEEAAQLDRLYGARPGASRSCPRASTRVLLAGRSRGARTALGLGDHPVLLFVGRIQPLKGLDVAVGRWPPSGIPTPCSSSSAVRAAPTATSTSGKSRRPLPSSASPTASASSRRSPTTCSRPTTAPPTCASCRAGPSRSGSSRSRRPRAARRSSRRRSAACAPSSTTATPASWSRAATPRCSRRTPTSC